MELFDIVKKIFSQNQNDWDVVSKNDKVRNFFMINRLMSIQFPIQANQFNKLRISPQPVIDWWRSTLSSRFSKVPYWIYTKTKKKDNVDKKKLEVNEEVEIFICNKFEISKRDLFYLKSFYPDKYKEWSKDLADQLGIKNQ